MVKRLEEDEKARIAKQKETLGTEGLKKVEEDLKAAKEEHDKDIPVEILKSFPVPSVKSISWIPVQSLQEVGSSAGRRTTVEQKDNNDLARYIQADGSPLPFFVQYDHVEASLPTTVLGLLSGLISHLQSDFVTISAYFSVATLPDELRPCVLICY